MSEWISVKERLPEPHVDALALKPCGPFVGYYNGKDWMVRTDEYNEVGITHWMPLPAPPEPKQKVKEALREAICLLDAARHSTMGRREIPLEGWFDWSSNIAIALPRLRSALESEE